MDQIQIHGLKFDQIQIQIQIRRICICICICKYKYVFDPSPDGGYVLPVVMNRVEVNSILELELQLNSNSNSGIGIGGIKNGIQNPGIGMSLELELKTGIELFATATTVTALTS